MKKKCKVVMLPTNEKARIGYLTAKGEEFKDLTFFNIRSLFYQLEIVIFNYNKQ